MWKEKSIETSIINFLKDKWAVVEQQNSWRALVKKWPKTYSITLQTEWATDIYCLYKWYYIGIEVKKDKEEVKKWLKIRDRLDWIWKPLPKAKYWKKRTYKREIDQINNSRLIQENWGTFILTCELEEVKEYINNL